MTTKYRNGVTRQYVRHSRHCGHYKKLNRNKMQFIFNDGGREQAGFKGRTGDCVVRAIAIATGEAYSSVYGEMKNEADEYATTRRDRVAKNLSKKGTSPRDGVNRNVYHSYLTKRGWSFVPTMSIGSGCKVHLKKDELPSGTIICRVSKHLVTVIDGVIYDTHDCSRDGTRCVYGYYQKVT